MSKKKLYAHILLDRSGSMEECRDTTIDAFNEYVNSLRLQPDVSALVSLTLFDDVGIDLVHDRVRAAAVPKLTRDVFVPRGRTPLNDAIGRTVSVIDRVELRDGENVAFVILTDGLENASQEYTKQAVKALLDGRQKDRNWLVIYLGANQDSFSEGAVRGAKAANTMDFDVAAMPRAMGSAARASVSFARSGLAEAAAFTAKERAAARK